MNNRQMDAMEAVRARKLDDAERALMHRLAAEYEAAGEPRGSARVQATLAVVDMRPGAQPGDYGPTVY